MCDIRFWQNLLFGRKWICVGKIRGINQGRLKSKPLKYCRFSLPFSNKQIVEAIKFNASKWRISVKTDDDDYLTSSGFYASGSAWRLSQPPKVQQYDLDGISYGPSTIGG